MIQLSIWLAWISSKHSMSIYIYQYISQYFFKYQNMRLLSKESLPYLYFYFVWFYLTNQNNRQTEKEKISKILVHKKCLNNKNLLLFKVYSVTSFCDVKKKDSIRKDSIRIIWRLCLCIKIEEIRKENAF